MDCEGGFLVCHGGLPLDVFIGCGCDLFTECAEVFCVDTDDAWPVSVGAELSLGDPSADG